jgi:hypothetical protein
MGRWLVEDGPTLWPERHERTERRGEKAAQEINGLTMYVRALDAQITMSVNDIAKKHGPDRARRGEAKLPITSRSKQRKR